MVNRSRNVSLWRILGMFVVVGMLFCCQSVQAFGVPEGIFVKLEAGAGASFSDKGVTYQILSETDHTVAVTKVDIETVNLELQSGTVEYNNTAYTITQIRKGAFAGCTSLNYVVFPDTITLFEEGILDGCSNLETIVNMSQIELMLPELTGTNAWVSMDTFTACDRISASGIKCATKESGYAVNFVFDYQDGRPKETQRVLVGCCATEPQTPVREGYIFGGWYTQATCAEINKYDFSRKWEKNESVVNYVLYAKWTKVAENSQFTQLYNGYTEALTLNKGERKWYSFTPAKSASYVFKVGNTSLYITYHGTDYSVIPSGKHFSQTQFLAEGQTYYYSVYDGTNNTNNCSISFFEETGDTPVITKKTISSCVVDEIPAQIYSGSNLTPVLTVRDGADVLKQGTDYTVSYSDNINAGTALVTIIGTGEKYTGSVVKKFTIYQAELTVTPKERMEVSYETGTVGEVSLSDYPGWEWQESEKTRTLEPNGVTTAVAVYKDTVNYKNAYVHISIRREAAPSNPVTAFTLSESSIEMVKGNGIYLSIQSTIPENPDSYTVSWRSSHDDIAQVNENGYITAESAGETEITASIDGAGTQTCKVIVKEATKELTGISVSPETDEITGGRLTAISVFPIPSDAYLGSVAFKSLNTEIAEVDRETGIVTGKKTGNTDVIVTAGGYTKVCHIKVSNPVTNFALDKQFIDLIEGDSAALNISYTEPATADDCEVTWNSSNSSVLEVTGNGGTSCNITAKKRGTATVTAVMNGISKSCTVIVARKVAEDESGNNQDGSQQNPKEEQKKPDESQQNQNESQQKTDAPSEQTNVAQSAVKIPVSYIRISCDTKKVAPGKKIKLYADVYPANADNQKVLWKVDNSKYASVSEEGVLTAKKAGKGKKVVVTALSSENGSIMASYTVSIMKNAVKKIKLTGKKTLKKGQSVKIKAVFTPSKNISKELTWTSGNTKIATVSKDGKVTAKKKGKVKITAKAKDGSGKKAVITIRIK